MRYVKLIISWGSLALLLPLIAACVLLDVYYVATHHPHDKQ
jgi:hypothetical protein